MNIESTLKEIGIIGNELRDIEYQLIRNSNNMGRYLSDGKPGDYLKRKMGMAIYSAIAARLGELSTKLLELSKLNEVI